MSLKPGLILFGADCDYWILLPRSQDLSPLFVNVAKKKARDIIDKSNIYYESSNIIQRKILKIFTAWTQQLSQCHCSSKQPAPT